MAYGVKANIRAPHRFLRFGALCWVTLLNNGWGNERLMVTGLSRSGRRVESWVDARDLHNWRAGWFPDHGEPIPFDSREDAEAFAEAMNELYASQPVRPHAAARGVVTHRPT